jgi:methenyltetrahydromethanopterin cyclohydrolase
VNETQTSTAADPNQQAIAANWPSVNALAAPMVVALIGDAAGLRLGIERLANGCVVVDAGIAHRGGLEAGRRIAEICMGGLGQVSLQTSGSARWLWQLSVHSSDPVLACLGSQYAGWSLSHGEGKGAFEALGSGPGRAAAEARPRRRPPRDAEGNRAYAPCAAPLPARAQRSALRRRGCASASGSASPAPPRRCSDVRSCR